MDKNLIRFRVYCEFEFDKEIYKSMESEASWFLITQVGELWSYGPMQRPSPLGKKYRKAIPLLLTGIKDKNGKEVCQGDILHIDRDCETLKLHHPSNEKVYWRDGEFICHRTRYPSDFTHYKIIGNVYENPELLEK